MNVLKRIFSHFHEKWAKEKFNLFLKKVELKKQDTILDLGGGDGRYMDRLSGQRNDLRVIIFDLDEKALKKASEKGYSTQYFDGASQRFPYKDQEIDCIFCNSVIEHVTLPKDRLWSEESRSEQFFEKSFQIQKSFADEIRRCSKKYYVQTPHKSFPIEAHTWFPFVSYLSRKNQLKCIKWLNKFWVKKTEPDWNLLTEKEMQQLFPEAEIIVLKKFGFKKEIIAIKN